MGASWDFSMPLEEAMTTQRTVRRLKPDAVDGDLVLRLVEFALKAPSGSNAQNWEFVVIRDAAVKAKLARRNRQAWHVYGRFGRWFTRNDPKMQRVLDAVDWQAEHFEEIPVLVIACLRGLRPWFPPIATAPYYGSIFPSVQNLLLPARAVGLGAALITLPLWSTLVGATHSRLPLERAALRGNPTRLAARPLRPHNAPPSWAMWSRSTATGTGRGRARRGSVRVRDEGRAMTGLRGIGLWGISRRPRSSADRSIAALRSVATPHAAAGRLPMTNALRLLGEEGDQSPPARPAAYGVDFPHAGSPSHRHPIGARGEAAGSRGRSPLGNSSAESHRR